MNSLNKNVLIWGASGHAKVLIPIVREMGFEVVAMIDKNPEIESFESKIQVFRSFEDLRDKMQNLPNYFCVAIGGNRGEDRLEIDQKLKDFGLLPLTLIHKASWVAQSAVIGQGSQILAMAAVCESVTIGSQSIVNTNASLDHETSVGNGCHIMPGATIAGCCILEDFVTIGSNATILPRIKIGRGAFVGAGAVVTKNISPGITVVGIPAKKNLN